MTILQGIAWTPSGDLGVANVYRGIAFSLTLGFVCFGLLSAAWLLVAVGVLRRSAAITA
jgi:hypothetical protein